MTKLWSRIIIFSPCFLVLLFSSCSKQNIEPSPLSSPNSNNWPQYGIAGLIPRHFPNSSADDWIYLYETLSETGTLLGVYNSWADSPSQAGRIPDAINTVCTLASHYHFTPVIAISFFSNDMPVGSLQSSLNLSSEQERALFQQTAVSIAETFHPPYFALGNEINRFYEVHPEDFENFLSLYINTYDAIKLVSPQTMVFTIFQLETLKGNGFLTGDSGTRRPQWELIAWFEGRLDLVAFTTYPFLDYQSPSEIPIDYYTEISSYTNKPIVFTEIGWSSSPLTPFPDSQYGGSEDEQAEFVYRFFDLTSNLNLALALWSFPNDLGAQGYPAFNSVSLRHNDGTRKPALVVWQEMINSIDR